MAVTAPLIALGGFLLAVAESRPWLLVVGAVLGTLSPNGQEAGPFAPMEQSLLPATVRSGSVVRVFGWYNVFAFLPAALGAGAAGGRPRLGDRAGIGELPGSAACSWPTRRRASALTLLYARLAACASPDALGRARP